ncbi:MAG: hypothetical protein A2W28_12950 [Gammaproteobacteria bacterium RBG_16_51_14]|nr:MAG: hypothetical protein A2W28_12950 [Gammaproteobacteria bacterium RBG_16_51_14]
MTITTHNLPNLDTNSDNDLIAFTTEILKETEGFIPFIYADSKGIPTLGHGVALVVKGVNGDWVVRPDNELNDIFDEVGHQLDAADFALLGKAVNALNGTIDPQTGQVPSNPFNEHTVTGLES